jgi:hypothetical protein
MPRLSGGRESFVGKYAVTDRDHSRRPSLSVPSFHETKERSDKTVCARLNCAADVIVYELSGLMFWFTQKKFVGSYLAFKATRRS